MGVSRLLGFYLILRQGNKNNKEHNIFCAASFHLTLIPRFCLSIWCGMSEAPSITDHGFRRKKSKCNSVTHKSDISRRQIETASLVSKANVRLDDGLG